MKERIKHMISEWYTSFQFHSKEVRGSGLSARNRGSSLVAMSVVTPELNIREFSKFYGRRHLVVNGDRVVDFVAGERRVFSFCHQRMKGVGRASSLAPYLSATTHAVPSVTRPPTVEFPKAVTKIVSQGRPLTNSYSSMAQGFMPKTRPWVSPKATFGLLASASN